MKKLRLLVFSKCNRNCEGCCNKEFDLLHLPVVKNLEKFDEIYLTGGEPLLEPDFLIKLILEIRKKSNARIFLYTAKIDDYIAFISVLSVLDGICVTLHESQDVEPFKVLNDYITHINTNKQSLRLNVFKGIDINGIDCSKWRVRQEIVWLKNCPLPDGEIFMRLKIGVERNYCFYSEFID